MEFVFSGSKPVHIKEFLRSLGISGTCYKKIKANKSLLLNGQESNSNVLLTKDDIVSCTLPTESNNLVPEKLSLAIIYESHLLLAVNKPAGLLVHPTVSSRTGSLANRVAAYYEQTCQQNGIHPVSRLDKNTSGLVLFAKNSYAQYVLSQQTMVKEYLALVEGCPLPLTGRIAAPIARKPGSIIERIVDFTKGAEAETEYKVLKNFGTFSLVRFALHTGKTHQIRVHSAYIGHPLLGDNLYGTPGPENRHLLHAWHLGLTEPLSGEKINIYCPLPKGFVNMLKNKEMCYNENTK